MKTLKESIITSTEKKVKGVGDVIDSEVIRDKLVNSGWYFFGFNDNKHGDIFNIYKKNGKWTVDVKGPMTCYGTPDGDITDGTFRFGTIDGTFRITHVPASTKLCQVKSLKNCPTEVKGSFEIWSSEYLKDLKDCPKHVHDSVIIYETPIKTLKHFPIWIGRNVLIVKNKNLKGVDDTKFCKIMGTSIEFEKNGFVSTERTYKELNWEFPYGFRGFRYDRNTSAPEFN